MIHATHPGRTCLGFEGGFVSSWELPGVLRVAADFGEVSTQVAGLSSPADIAVDEGRKRILIPRLLEDRAEFHPF